MAALDGNSSDKVSFHDTIARVKAFQSQIAVQTPFKWIADSALYSKDKLFIAERLSLGYVEYRRRINEAKALVSKPTQEIAWVECRGGYRTASYSSSYGGIDQRWLLVYSEQAYQREKKTLERKLVRQQQQLENTLWHLHNEVVSM